MNVQIFALPYDSGHRDMRMGAGPLHFLKHDLEQCLRADHTLAPTQILEAPDSFSTENKTAFSLYGSLSHGIRDAQAFGSFPLVLSGNCGAAMGAVSGLSPDDLGLIWFDCHGDFNTPETTASGFLDGMGMAVMARLACTAICTETTSGATR